MRPGTLPEVPGLSAQTARSLAPADFGVFRVLLTLTAIVMIVNELGVPDTLVQRRELRAAELRDEVMAIDTRIEERGDTLIAALSSIGDSKDTRTKVARMKRDTVDRLQKTIEYYRQKRAAMQEELRRPTWHLTADEKRTVIARFDERIEKRVAQIGISRESYAWYLDLRRYGSVPHSGFGLGVERTVAWVCGLSHIRETIPYPRMLKRLYP